jgi:Domain of unknown function (DUF1707)
MAARPDLRIGDADREAAAASLREHFAQGRLSLTEFNERIDAVFAASTQGDLDHITRDLPHVRVPTTPLPGAGIRPIGPGGSGSGAHGGQRGPSSRLGIVVSLVGVMAMWFAILASMLLLRFPFAGKFSLLFGVFVIVRSVFRRIFGGRGAGRGGGGRRYHYHGHWRAHHESWHGHGADGLERHGGFREHPGHHHGHDGQPW